MNNPQLLIDAIVQQTMVFIAHLATAGGVRAPLVGLANQVFADLTHELEKQGVKKKVIADMFGMALRTYHRRAQELRLSQTEEGRTLWEAVYGFLKDKGRARATEIHHRFRHDDVEMVTGVLSDLVSSGLVYRTGRGHGATYKVAGPEDFDSADESRSEANRYLIWLTVYRHGPATVQEVAETARLGEAACQRALDELTDAGRVVKSRQGERVSYECGVLDVPLGSTQGWEAAVLDHFQAMTSAIAQKLQRGPSPPGSKEVVGGSTWSLDVWNGHPLAEEATGTLARIRSEVEGLRGRIDSYNAAHAPPARLDRVVIYAGQYVREEDSSESNER